MISFKKYKSRYIAAIATILIQLILFVLLSVEFSGEESSRLSNAELDFLELQMQEMAREEISNTPPGKDPLTAQKDKASESISKEKGQVKTQASPQTSAPVEDERPVASVDTLIIPKREVTLLKVDTPKVFTKDSVIIAQIFNKPKVAGQKDQTHQREKYEYYQKNFKNIRNFKKVYPYALIIRQMVENLNTQLSTITNESEKRKLIKESEKMLFKQYETAVRNMTRSQGELLLKLISRETSKTGYELIKDYRGAIPATFWYGIGKIFGTDLKTEFHKEKEDSVIENILDKYNKNDLY
jgi:hypothetical protein